MYPALEIDLHLDHIRAARKRDVVVFGYAFRPPRAARDRHQPAHAAGL